MQSVDLAGYSYLVIPKSKYAEAKVDLLVRILKTRNIGLTITLQQYPCLSLK